MDFEYLEGNLRFIRAPGKDFRVADFLGGIL